MRRDLARGGRSWADMTLISRRLKGILFRAVVREVVAGVEAIVVVVVVVVATVAVGDGDRL